MSYQRGGSLSQLSHLKCDNSSDEGENSETYLTISENMVDQQSYSNDTLLQPLQPNDPTAYRPFPVENGPNVDSNGREQTPGPILLESLNPSPRCHQLAILKTSPAGTQAQYDYKKNSGVLITIELWSPKPVQFPDTLKVEENKGYYDGFTYPILQLIVYPPDQLSPLLVRLTLQANEIVNLTVRAPPLPDFNSSFIPPNGIWRRDIQVGQPFCPASKLPDLESQSFGRTGDYGRTLATDSPRLPSSVTQSANDGLQNIPSGSSSFPPQTLSLWAANAVNSLPSSLRSPLQLGPSPKLGSSSQSGPFSQSGSLSQSKSFFRLGLASQAGLSSPAMTTFRVSSPFYSFATNTAVAAPSPGFLSSEVDLERSSPSPLELSSQLRIASPLARPEMGSMSSPGGLYFSSHLSSPVPRSVEEQAAWLSRNFSSTSSEAATLQIPSTPPLPTSASLSSLLTPPPLATDATPATPLRGVSSMQDMYPSNTPHYQTLTPEPEQNPFFQGSSSSSWATSSPSLAAPPQTPNISELAQKPSSTKRKQSSEINQGKAKKHQVDTSYMAEDRVNGGSSYTSLDANGTRYEKTPSYFSSSLQISTDSASCSYLAAPVPTSSISSPTPMPSQRKQDQPSETKKSTSRKYQVGTSHMTRDLDGGGFQCTFEDKTTGIPCGKIHNSRRNNLVDHYKKQHERDDLRKFKCEFCAKDFVDKSSLDRHVKPTHPEVYQNWRVRHYHQ